MITLPVAIGCWVFLILFGIYYISGIFVKVP